MENKFFDIFIRDFFNNKPLTIDDLDEFSKISLNHTRYYKICHIIQYLSSYSLNKDKNKNKGNFEDISLEKVIHLLVLELKELKFELMKDEKEFDYERILEEIADVSACLTGLLAKILDMYKKRGEQ